MSIRWILLVLFVIGAVLYARTAPQASRMRAEYRRLCKVVGEFEPSDEQHAWVKLIPSTEPSTWRWRVYLPPNFDATRWWFCA